MRPESLIFTLQGDGDMVSEGLQEVIHTAARGEAVTCVLLNNGVFGETGGHMTATTVLGQRTKNSLDGRDAAYHGHPILIADILAGLGGTAYAARCGVFNAAEVARTRRVLEKAFQTQIEYLRERCEMASLESALAFLAGRYAPSKDLCLLTFDDGLKEHYEVVAPVLRRCGAQGIFALITRCAEGAWVAPAHKNHFLMATLSLETYRASYEGCLRDRIGQLPDAVPRATLEATYRWDDPETSKLKYMINFQTPAHLREYILSQLFA